MPTTDDLQDAADTYNEYADQYNEYKDFYDKAKSCVDDYSSESCQDFVGEQGEKALIAAGVDPKTAKEIVQCAQTRDREACAKGSAKLAATYACVAATSGAGTVVCNQLAPVLIDKLWPVIGPPLTATWDIGLDMLEAALSMLKGMFEDIAGLLGFGDDGPTWTDRMNALRWKSAEIMNDSISNAFNAVRKADVESRIQVGLQDDDLGSDHPVRSGDIAAPQIVPMPPGVEPMMPQIVKAGQRGAEVLQHALREHPSFGEIWIVGRRRKVPWDASGNYGRFDFAIVDPGYQIGNDEVLMRSSAMPAGWMPGDEWTPAGFQLEQHPPMGGARWQTGDVRDALGFLLSIRSDAVRTCCADAVGKVVAENVQAVTAKKLPMAEKESSSWLLWVAALAGAGTLAYVYRDKIKKAMR
jgi:hypothetical protein